jgi:fructokinase
VFDVVTLGEILIDLIATRQNVSLYDTPAFEPLPGGAPANVAVGVARLGKRAAFIGKVGGDDFGTGLRRLLETEHVATQGLVTDPQSLTTLALVALHENGDPHFAFHFGALATLTDDEIDPDVLRQARIFHIGSLSLAHEPVRTTTLEAFQFARDAGATCSYDVNWRPMLWPDQAMGIALARRPLALADIVKLNAAELRLLAGIDDPQTGLERLETDAALVVVTLGAQGCLYRFQGNIGQCPAPAVAQMVDATGAGDAFMAALLASLPEHLRDLDQPALFRCLQRACHAGAIAVTRRGAIPALPYARELEDGEGLTP